MSDPRMYRCAVCKQQKPLRNEKGAKAAFQELPGDRKACTVCVRQRDRAAFRAGRLTARAFKKDLSWHVRSLGGDFEYKLTNAPARTPLARLPAFEFQDKSGAVWTGRLYAKESLVFQRNRRKAAARPGDRTDAAAPTAKSAAPAAAAATAKSAVPTRGNGRHHKKPAARRKATAKT